MDLSDGNRFVASSLIKGVEQKELRAQTCRILPKPSQICSGMLLDKTLDPADFKAIKARYETTIYELEKRLRNISHENNELDEFIRYGRLFFRSMDQFYVEGTLSVKQQLVGSMFPEKLIFENKTYRTIERIPSFT